MTTRYKTKPKLVDDKKRNLAVFVFVLTIQQHSVDDNNKN